LWQGLDKLREAVFTVLPQIGRASHCHVITMTGELADIFPDRNTGVRQIAGAMTQHLGDAVQLYAGSQGFVSVADIGRHTAAIASANWLASAEFLASQVQSGLLVDIGSTTADLVPLANSKSCHRGTTDAERMHYEELVYTGVVRTALMTLGPRVPFAGEWRSLAAEYFATTADIYRLTGDLNEADDMAGTADGASKTAQDSARRLARMLGHDVNDAPRTAWIMLAHAFKQQQIERLKHAALRGFSRNIVDVQAPIIGAGAGRFLACELARQLNRPYLDVTELLSAQADDVRRLAGICLPAYAVARLAFNAAGIETAA
jgi:probable H4MPT-linked C1 transfer pathway protein